MSENTIKVLPVGDIRISDFSLRKVDKESEKYLGLVESIRIAGFIGAVTVRPVVTETGAKVFELVDGLHRLTAAIDAGLEKIPVVSVELDPSGVLETQILGNVHKIETAPSDYSKQLKRWLILNPMATVRDLASKLGMDEAWVKGRLAIANIENKAINEAINDGRITVHNAMQLSKLPDAEQAEWAERAMSMPVAEFTKEVSERVKALREHARKGLDAPPETFEPTPVLRKLGSLRDAKDNPTLAENIINTAGAKDAISAAQAVLNWVFQLDPVSLKEREALFNTRKAEREARAEAAAAKKRESQIAKAKKLAEDAADAQAALEEATA